jgi:hypothetical protein
MCLDNYCHVINLIDDPTNCGDSNNVSLVKVGNSIEKFRLNLSRILKYLLVQEIKKIQIFDRNACKLQLNEKLFEISLIFSRFTVYYYSSAITRSPDIQNRGVKLLALSSSYSKMP